jgi:hypothetical protein
MDKKMIIVIFITGLHKKPQGCGASVASAAGPFINKKKKAHVLTLQKTRIFSNATVRTSNLAAVMVLQKLLLL